jgi:hypothetical protein
MISSSIIAISELSENQEKDSAEDQMHDKIIQFIGEIYLIVNN